MLFRGKKAEGVFGATVLVGIIFFNLLLYVFIYFANQSALINIESSGTISQEELSTTNPFSWTDGFKISVFGTPEWFNYLYVTLLGALSIIASWYAFKGS